MGRLWIAAARIDRFGSPDIAGYEAFGYDDAGNLTGKRLRSGEVIGFSYDGMNGMTGKILPGGPPNFPPSSAWTSSTVPFSRRSRYHE